MGGARMLHVDIKKKLADFTLELQYSLDNDILVLFGPSGCGKTTTLRCIAGLTQPDEGEIRHGERVLFSSAKKVFMPPRARNVGYMFQDFALFPHMNVKKNIWYGVKQADAKAQALYERLVELLKIGHLADRFIGRLSGGEKQRVALARALMAEPDILLLDEPLSSLDRATRLELQAELKRMHELWRIPFVLVTHDLQEAEALSNRILFIENGRQRPEELPRLPHNRSVSVGGRISPASI